MQQVERPGSDRVKINGAATRASRCAIWGVVNVTPDSFSDGGQYFDCDAAVARGRALLAQGADVLDVGGESSRPAGQTYGDGFSRVPADEEAARVVPVVRRLAGEGARVSIDTVKPAVAAQALGAGAVIVNDVSCARDGELARVAADAGADYVVMHNRGNGEVASPNTDYDDVVTDVLRELAAAAERVQAAGVPKGKVWIDPGIGFAKNAEQSAALLGALDRFVSSGHKVLVGPSRKAFIGALTARPDGEQPGPTDRIGGTAAAVTAAALAGCHAVRVHDVGIMHQAVRVAEALEARR